MKKNQEPVTFERIKETHKRRRREIKERLNEFRDLWKNASNERLFEEMVYCFYTGGCSAKMGLKSVEVSRPHLLAGSHEDVMNSLVGSHRYPRARARYVIESRTFLEEHCGLRIREVLEAFSDPLERRDWLVKEKGIKGLGYKEASHFLRNIGLPGYGILDKHVLRCLADLKIISEPKPPNTRLKYLTIENKLRKVADQINIDFDEMDLVLWSMKTGEILK